MKYLRLNAFMISVLVLLGTTHPVCATDYYVSPNGDDAKAGSQAAPWKTLQQAANKATAGDTVLVADGTYAGFFTSNSGTNQAPIVFLANGKNVVIQSKSAATNDNINIEGTNYIVIDGFIVKNGKRGGIRIAEASGVIIQNNQVGPCQKWCIFTAFAPDVQIINNKAFNATEQHGIYVSNSSGPNDNPIIRGNTTYGNGRSGIQINGDCYTNDTKGKSDGVISGALIENNVVYDNTAKGMSLISMQDSIVRNNLIYHNRSGAGGIHLTDEPDCGKPSSRNLIVNNTIVESKIAGIRITDDAVENIIFNNIVIGLKKGSVEDEVGGSFIDKESNLLFQTMPTRFFVDAEKKEFHLLPTSAARDKGKAVYKERKAPAFDFELRARPQGKGVDIGAYAFSSSGQ